jgi:hypothetical protein
VAFDQKRVLNRLDILSRKAEELGQISAAVRCEELIGKHRGMFIDRTALQWERDPSQLTDEQLEALGGHFLRSMVGDDPSILAEARKQIEAAIVVEAVAVEN